MHLSLYSTSNCAYCQNSVFGQTYSYTHTHTHTHIHTHTHETTTVTLSAHARRGLIIIIHNYSTSLNIYLSEIRPLLIMASTFLSWFGQGAKYQPTPRAFHTSAQVGSKTLLHGGVTEDYSEKTKQRLSSVLEVFDSNTELWQQKKVKGDTPAPGVFGAASATVNGDLFTFGGYDGKILYSSLHRLKNASQWLKLCPQNEKAESPMVKTGARMVAFGNQLLLIGGYGIPHSPTQSGAAFIKDRTRGAPYGAGWTNELHIFNIKNGMHLSMSFNYYF